MGGRVLSIAVARFFLKQIDEALAENNQISMFRDRCYNYFFMISTYNFKSNENIVTLSKPKVPNLVFKHAPKKKNNFRTTRKEMLFAQFFLTKFKMLLAKKCKDK
jgi:hypothetical protein